VTEITDLKQGYGIIMSSELSLIVWPNKFETWQNVTSWSRTITF